MTLHFLFMQDGVGWMKIRTDEDVRNRLMMSMGLIAVGSAILMLGFDIGYGWILAGLILTLGALYNAAKPKEDFIEDERSVRNKEKAGYHAFNTMFMLIIIFTVVLYETVRRLWKGCRYSRRDRI